MISLVIAGVAALRIPNAIKAAAFAAVFCTLFGLTTRSSRRFASDETVWAQALEVDPDSPIANLNYASDLVNRNQFDDAMPYLKRAFQSKMMIAPVWGNLGRIAEAKQDYNRALVCYGNAVQIDGNDAATRFQYGTMLLLAGQLPQAAEQLQMALRYQPNNAESHDNLGICLLHMGQRTHALNQFKIAQQLKPDLPRIHQHLMEAGH